MGKPISALATIRSTKKARQVFLSDQGHEKVEQMLSTPDCWPKGRP